MLKIEDQLVINKYKFGLLYVKAGQKTENDMYANEGGGSFSLVCTPDPPTILISSSLTISF